MSEPFAHTPENVAADLQRLVNVLDDFSEIAEGEGERALKKAHTLLMTKLGTYPPPPPNSTYVRTGKLGQGWTRDAAKAKKMRLEFSNKVPYARYVQGKHWQAKIHKGRWTPAADILWKETAALTGILDEAAMRMVTSTRTQAKSPIVIRLTAG